MDDHRRSVLTGARLRRLVLILGAVILLVGLVPGSGASTLGQRAESAREPSGQSVVLALAGVRRAALDRYVAGLDRPGSPDFHRFLSPAAVRARFGASSEETTAVLARLRGLGIADARVSADRSYITASLPARSGHDVTALRDRLGSLVSGLITADQLPTMTPQIDTLSNHGGVLPSHVGDRRADVLSGVDGGASPCINAVASGAYTAPQLASAYNFNALYAEGDHGEGMSAAVLEFGGYHSGNIAAFDSCYGLHTPVSRVLVDGGAAAPSNSSEGEVTLDIETLSELAPDLAHIYVYEATSELDAYDAFVSQDRAAVLSVSWGECEEQANSSYERLLGLITEEGDAQGQQIFVASGDSGSETCKGAPDPTGVSLSTDTEAALPWVTGVGGTDLSEASAAAGATVHREDVWNDGLGAGGGGQSVVWAMPSWQRNYLSSTGDHPAGLANDCGAPAGEDCRMVPDIAFDADAEEGGADPHLWGVPVGPTPAQFSSDGDRGAPGYAIYCASSDCYGGGDGWQPVGGTSAATPVAAAATVLWDQQAAKQGVRLGFLNPALYAIAANPTDYARDFDDVTSGNNDPRYTTLACVDGCGASLYQAGTGYDMATGLGAVNVGNLAGDLLANAGALTLTPDSERLYGDTDGGPATTAPVLVSAAARAVGSDTWTARSSAGWLVLDAASGHTPQSLRWHVDPAGLAPGTYAGTITITAADGSTTPLSVLYSISTPAKLALITPSLHFYERQVKPAGAKRLSVCGTPLWGDELEVGGIVPGATGISTPGDRAPGTHLVLVLANRGAPDSVLHYSVDTSELSWAGPDNAPGGRLRAIQRRPGQPLVPSEGRVAGGHRAGIALASLANDNVVGGYPALQQGTYHARIVIRDLADPADRVSVPVTLTLGSGQGTPRIGTREPRLAVSLAPGGSKVIDLGLSDPGGACGYAYSLSTDATWLQSDHQRRAGTVPARGTWEVPLSVRVPLGTAAGTYTATVTIASDNAENGVLSVPVRLTVR